MKIQKEGGIFPPKPTGEIKMVGKKLLVPGYLFNEKEGYTYPHGKLFTDENAYVKAIAEGWVETPYESKKPKEEHKEKPKK